MKFWIKIFLLLFITSNLIGKVKVIGKYKTFEVFSKNRQTEYFILNPQEKIKLKIPIYSRIYVRAVVTNRNLKSYYFKIISNGYEKTYKRKLKISKSVQGIHKEHISTLTKIVPKSRIIIIKNISDISILVRVKEKYGNLNFVPITPEKYGKIENIKIKDKTIGYYRANDEILLKIKGKAYLKVISRATHGKEYHYTVYDNAKILAYEKIKFEKSKYFDSISKGSVRIYEFSKGEHNVKIIADKNVIFRFFINKKAVRLTQ